MPDSGAAVDPEVWVELAEGGDPDLAVGAADTFAGAAVDDLGDRLARLARVLADEGATLAPPSAGPTTDEGFAALPARRRIAFTGVQLARLDPRLLTRSTLSLSRTGSIHSGH